MYGCANFASFHLFLHLAFYSQAFTIYESLAMFTLIVYDSLEIFARFLNI